MMIHFHICVLSLHGHVSVVLPPNFQKARVAVK